LDNELSLNQIFVDRKSIMQAFSKVDCDALDKKDGRAGGSTQGGSSRPDITAHEISKVTQKALIKKLSKGTFSNKPFKFPIWTKFKIQFSDIKKFDEQKSNIRGQHTAVEFMKTKLVKPINGTNLLRSNIFKAIDNTLDVLCEQQDKVSINLYGPVCNIQVTVKLSLKDQVLNLLLEDYNLNHLQIFEDEDIDCTGTQTHTKAFKGLFSDLDTSDFENSQVGSSEPETTIFGTVSLGSMETLSDDLKVLTAGQYNLSSETGEFDKIE